MTSVNWVPRGWSIPLLWIGVAAGATTEARALPGRSASAHLDVPKLSLDFDVTNEGRAGERRTLTFRLNLSTSPILPVVVTYTVTDGAGPGLPAASGGRGCGPTIDYLAASGTVTIATGQTTQAVPITICGDPIYETDERLTFRVTAATNALLAEDAVVGVIVNDDVKPVITVMPANDGLVTEGTGGTTMAPVIVSLSSPHHTGASLKLARSGSARPAIACTGSADLQATSDTIQVSWPAGNNDNWTVNLPVCGDNRDEGNDIIDLAVAVVVNATVAPGSQSRRIVIFDDDPPPVISVADVSVIEGAAAQVGVSLSAASDRDIEVLLTAASGAPSPTATMATAGEACAGTVDFLTASRRIVVPAGKTSATFPVTTCGNVDYGTNPASFPGPGYAEVFLVTASAPTNATLGRVVGTVTVRDP
ncbi:MAG: hypothetical protein ACKVZ0_19810 [Gemmatimonadales bacterium]